MSALLATTAGAEPTLPRMSPGDTLRLLTRSREWHDGVLDSIAPDRFYLRKPARSRSLWIECESVDRAYRQAPREVTAVGVLTGFGVGTMLGALVGIFVGRAQSCEDCEINLAPAAAFIVSTAAGLVVGTVVGCIPMRQWTPVATCAEGDP